MDSNPARPRAEEATLFLAGNSEIWVVDVDKEQVEHLRVPDLGAGDPPHLIESIGDHLALWNYDVTSVPVANPAAPPETIADDGWIFIPAADPSHIWVGFLDADRPRAERALGELREIDGQGNVITSGIEPPGGAWPEVALARGFLFWANDGAIRLWDLEQRRTVRTYQREEIGDIPGPVTGDLLASCIGGCKELILTDFETGDQRRIPAPTGRAFMAREAAFSPDGETLAVPVTEATGDAGSLYRNPRELGLLSVDTGEIEIVSGSRVQPGYLFTDWMRGGGEVYMTGGGAGTRREIISHRLGEDRARRLAVDVGDFYDVAAG